MGTYFHFATDAVGCYGVTELELIPQSAPNLGIPLIDGSCPNQSNGAFSMIADNNANGTDYNFSWSNGVIQNNINHTELWDLTSGTCTVTITGNNTNCEIINEYEIPEIIPDIPLSMSPTISNPCPQENNGEIKTNTYGGIPPYLFSWNDGYSNNSPQRPNLGEGTYTVTVTDYCDNSLIQSFILDDLGYSSTLQTGCENEGAIELHVFGGNSNHG